MKKRDAHNRKFKSFEKAKKFLELRRRHAHRRIELEGDIILSDNSIVSNDFSDMIRPVEERGHYITVLLITTKNMVDDLLNFQTPDLQKLESKQ